MHRLRQSLLFAVAAASAAAAKDWMAPAELKKAHDISAAFVLVLAGMATMDFIANIDFDISIITGKRKWRHPMILYFITRICMLLHIFPLALRLNAIHEIPCMRVVYIAKVAVVVGTLACSLILLLRTHAVWGQKNYIGIPLFVLWLGQIASWVQTLRYTKLAWNVKLNQCQELGTAPRSILVSVFSYNMAVDTIILTLCAVKLSSSRHAKVGSVLLRDGILYFLVVFTANLIQMVFGLLQLNPVMNIMGLPFALVVSCIATGAIFRHVFQLYDGFARTQNSSELDQVSANAGSWNKRAPKSGQSTGIPLGTMNTVNGVTVATVVEYDTKVGDLESHIDFPDKGRAY